MLKRLNIQIVLSIGLVLWLFLILIISPQLMKVIENEIMKNSAQQKQPQDYECPQTKLCIWEEDQFEELEVDYLNQVFPEKLNKNTLSKGTCLIFHFLSSSLYYWIELRETCPPQSEKLSLKDAKFIQELFRQSNVQNYIAFNRWGQFFNQKNQFQQRMLQQKSFKVPPGQIVHSYTRNNMQFQIVRYLGDNQQFNDYKKRFQVLFLFYIDGVSYVWQESDQWVYFIIYRIDNQARHFVGVVSKYEFRISSIKQRHRISQILILPSYQNQGHGKQLLDIVYDQSLNLKECFQITTEAPSFEFQCLRDFKQSEIILTASIFNLKSLTNVKTYSDLQQNRSLLLNRNNIRVIKQKLKIPGHQIQRIVNILLYNHILEKDSQEAQAIFEQQLRQSIIYNTSAFKSRNKLPHITYHSQFQQIKHFLLEKSKDQFNINQSEIQQILTETLNGFRRISNKLTKMKLV